MSPGWDSDVHPFTDFGAFNSLHLSPGWGSDVRPFLNLFSFNSLRKPLGSGGHVSCIVVKMPWFIRLVLCAAMVHLQPARPKSGRYFARATTRFPDLRGEGADGPMTIRERVTPISIRQSFMG